MVLEKIFKDYQRHIPTLFPTLISALANEQIDVINICLKSNSRKLVLS